MHNCLRGAYQKDEPAIFIRQPHNEATPYMYAKSNRPLDSNVIHWTEDYVKMSISYRDGHALCMSSGGQFRETDRHSDNLIYSTASDDSSECSSSFGYWEDFRKIDNSRQYVLWWPSNSARVQFKLWFSTASRERRLGICTISVNRVKILGRRPSYNYIRGS